MEAQVNVAHLLAQPHQIYNWNVEQPSFGTITNRVEWKSDNYKIKEITFIQTGRRGRVVEWTGPTSMSGG